MNIVPSHPFYPGITFVNRVRSFWLTAGALFNHKIRPVASHKVARNENLYISGHWTVGSVSQYGVVHSSCTAVVRTLLQQSGLRNSSMN